MLNNKNFQIVVLIALAVMLQACSPATSATSGSSDYASTSVSLPTTISNITATTSARALVQCNSSSASSNSFRIALAADIENGAVNTNAIYVRFTSLPTSFATDSSFIELFETMGVGASSYYLNPSAVSLTVVDPSTGTVILSGVNWIRWSDVQSQANAMGYTDPTTFFSRMIVIANLNDPNGQYESLVSALYNSSGSPLDQANTLLPVFNADPTSYATKADNSARSSVMTALHPFNGQNVAALTVAQLQTEANALCAPFN